MFSNEHGLFSLSVQLILTALCCYRVINAWHINCFVRGKIKLSGGGQKMKKNILFSVAITILTATLNAEEPHNVITQLKVAAVGAETLLPVPAASPAASVPLQPAARFAIYSTRDPIYSDGSGIVSIVSKNLMEAGYSVISSHVNAPGPDNFSEWYTYSIAYEAKNGGVTHEALTIRTERYAARDSAESAGAEVINRIKKEGYRLLYSSAQEEYSPFSGWFFRIDYILPADAALD